MLLPDREVIVPANCALNSGVVLGLPMSTAVRGGELIFLSGLFAVDPDSGARWHGSAIHEARRIFTAMGQILEGRGSSLAHVVKLHVFLADMLEMDNINAICRSFFPADPPARTICGTKLFGGSRVEIDCVALAGDIT